MLMHQCSQRVVRGYFLSLGCLASASRKGADVDDQKRLERVISLCSPIP